MLTSCENCYGVCLGSGSGLVFRMSCYSIMKTSSWHIWYGKLRIPWVHKHVGSSFLLLMSYITSSWWCSVKQQRADKQILLYWSVVVPGWLILDKLCWSNTDISTGISLVCLWMLVSREPSKQCSKECKECKWSGIRAHWFKPGSSQTNYLKNDTCPFLDAQHY